MTEELKMGESRSDWVCRTCKGEPQFMDAEFKEHAKHEHGLGSGLKGARQMLMHMDDPEYARSTYEWTFGEVKFTQFVVHRRAADDMMRWG